MWTSPPTAQGKRGLDRPLLKLTQRRPGTKLSVAAAPADGRVTTSSSTPPEPREDWEHGVDLYVARQPILDRSRRTYAYELLFRDGLVNAFSAEDPDLATARVIDTSFFVLGIESLTGGRTAFVNFTRQALVGGYASALPSNLLVVEILEDVPADPRRPRSLLGAQSGRLRHRARGHRHHRAAPGLSRPRRHREGGLRQDERLPASPDRPGLRRPGTKMLAEKVEAQEDFNQALHGGSKYFQGCFFARPSIVAGWAIAASKLNILNLISEVHRPDLVHAHVENIINRSSTPFSSSGIRA